MFRETTGLRSSVELTIIGAIPTTVLTAPSPAGPRSPLGIVNVSSAAELVPVLITEASQPAGPVIVLSIAIVAAEPSVPFVPGVPVGPGSP